MTLSPNAVAAKYFDDAAVAGMRSLPVTSFEAVRIFYSPMKRKMFELIMKAEKQREYNPTPSALPLRSL
ncbi:hypothetical protein AB4Z52_02645 [Rhizobium sp. 2YAF20]|uniref:hypothetical protein n=1 Tax=Rhizobium sp. 2YAF20 TaxID=3233027 RepID=UPI003F94B454